MAGTIRGRVECYSNNGNVYLNYQEMFTNCYQFLKSQLEPAGVVTEVARNNGQSGTGTDYHNGSNPFGGNAFAVFRWNSSMQGNTGSARTWPYYMLIQWYRWDQNLFGVSPGNPGLLGGSSSVGSNSAGFGISYAIGIGGDENPWNGTTPLGSSVKGANVWKVPTGGNSVMCFPRSNNSGDITTTVGTHATTKENNYLVAGKTNTVAQRYHFLADSDNFLMLLDRDADGYYNGHYAGLYTPRSGLTATYPFVCLQAQAITSTQMNTQIGSINGTNQTTEGAACVDGTRGVRQMMLGRYDEFFTTTTQPNQSFSPAKYDEFPLSLGLYEFPSYFGYLGQIEFLRETYNVPNLSTNTDGSRVYLGGPTTSLVKWSCPWTNSATPGTGTTRTGVSF
jgi:hypothetical protein